MPIRQDLRDVQDSFVCIFNFRLPAMLRNARPPCKRERCGQVAGRLREVPTGDVLI